MDNRINKNGGELLQTFISGITNEITELTQQQVYIILSLQNMVKKDETGEWKVNNKKKGYGKLRINKISENYFSDHNS